jgi:hypothetical protein
LGDKKVHTQRNSVCARLPVHLKPEFLLGSAYLIAEFLSKLYLRQIQYKKYYPARSTPFYNNTFTQEKQHA